MPPRVAPAAPSATDLEPVELAALAVLVRAAEKSKYVSRLEPGMSRHVDFRLRIRGEVDLAEPQTATVTRKPDAERVLAAVLELLGPKTAQRVGESLKLGLPDEVSPAAAAAAAIVVDALAVRETQQRRGNLTGRVEAVRVR